MLDESQYTEFSVNYAKVTDDVAAPSGYDYVPGDIPVIITVSLAVKHVGITVNWNCIFPK